MEYVPVIDFSSYALTVDENNTDALELSSLADRLCDVFSTIGFVYIKNHGISSEKVQKAFVASAEFFQQPETVKERYRRGTGLQNHGWCCIERERVNPERQPDRKECFDINPLVAKEWPSDNLAAGFQDVTTSLYGDCRMLASRLLHLMAIGLKLKDPHYFTKLFNADRRTYTALRSLYYPPVNADTDLKANQLRCGEHTDYGALTILFQDSMGGLEVFNRQGRYVPAPPIPDTVVVNLGDLMQRWTADVLVSTKHRVLLPPEATHRQQPRQSIVCFVHPDADCVVTCIDDSNKYEPIRAADYIEKRFNDTLQK